VKGPNWYLSLKQILKLIGFGVIDINFRVKYVFGPYKYITFSF